MGCIPVLMYHAVESADHPAGGQDAGWKRYVLHLEKFAEQMAYLHRTGFRTLLLDELLHLDEWPDKGVILTFDDGHVSNFRLALPLLRRYGFKAEFFITTNWIGTPHYMTAEEIKALDDAGMGIGSHGVTHTFLDDLDETEMERELRESMEVLTRILGRRISCLSAPGGRLRFGVAAVAERLGYSMLCTSMPGVLNQGHSPFSIPRMALRRDTDMDCYRAMVHADRKYVDRLTRHHNLLLLAKKALGNKGYEKMRGLLLGRG